MSLNTNARDELIYWIALKQVEGVGNVFYKRLIASFHNARAVFSASAEELGQVEGISGTVVSRIRRFRAFDEAKEELNRIKQQKADIITLNDARYPELLKQISDPPPYLYARGMPDTPLQGPCVAIVGTRFPSAYGENITREIASALTGEGFTIVSGMAKGIDSIAHKTAIKHKGRTIAVWGTGINRIYPPENKQLAQDIAKYGLILTEYPAGTPPLDVNFPERNRIISGLSVAVIVTEASLNSGTMITVSHALDQGREVFAVPGQIHSMMSQGTNRLIKQVGNMVDSVDNLVREIKACMPAERDKKTVMPESHACILSILSGEPVDLDTVIARSKFDTSKVMSILTEMELTGVVKQLPGQRFVKME